MGGMESDSDCDVVSRDRLRAVGLKSPMYIDCRSGFDIKWRTL